MPGVRNADGLATSCATLLKVSATSGSRWAAMRIFRVWVFKRLIRGGLSPVVIG
jgi:hypothetical protein